MRISRLLRLPARTARVLAILVLPLSVVVGTFAASGTASATPAKFTDGPVGPGIIGLDSPNVNLGTHVVADYNYRTVYIYDQGNSWTWQGVPYENYLIKFYNGNCMASNGSRDVVVADCSANYTVWPRCQNCDNGLDKWINRKWTIDDDNTEVLVTDGTPGDQLEVRLHNQSNWADLWDVF